MLFREQNLNVLANWENWDLTWRGNSGNIHVYGKRPNGRVPVERLNKWNGDQAATGRINPGILTDL
jgi:hypothetical protein